MLYARRRRVVAEIIIVTGIQAAGKSTVSRLLARRFERGACIEADALQRMIVSGGAWVTDGGGPGAPSVEAARQLSLRLHNACLLARSFHEAVFTAVIDDIVLGERFNELKEELHGVPFRLVVLAPDVNTVVERDANRPKSVGPEWADFLDRELRATMTGVGLWVDSTRQTPDQTVDEITRRLSEEGMIDA